MRLFTRVASNPPISIVRGAYCSSSRIATADCWSGAFVGAGVVGFGVSWATGFGVGGRRGGGGGRAWGLWVLRGVGGGGGGGGGWWGRESRGRRGPPSPQAPRA